MLNFLRVKNIALAVEVQVPLGAGLTVLTGETGAGKSLIVDALGLLLGAKGGPDLIRTGEAVASVEGVFEGRGMGALLAELSLPEEGDEVVVRREILATGRSRATVNGALVPLTTLRSLSSHLGVIHGQHEHRDLLDAESHRAALDRFAEASKDAEAVSAAYDAWRQVEEEIVAFRTSSQNVAARREILEFQLGEIDALAIAAGEEEQLEQERALAANASRLAALAGEAYAILYEDEASVLTGLAAVYKRVGDLAAIDSRFAEHAAGREAIVPSLDDLSLFLRDYRDRLPVEPGRLDALESRLAQIGRAKKKYGGTVGAMLAQAESWRAELGSLRSPEDVLRHLEARQAKAAERYRAVARALSKRRRAAAPALETRVRGELNQLAMEKASFKVRFDPPEPTDRKDPAAQGFEDVEFLLSANAGEELRPMSKIASGGELSRILLALKTVDRGDARGETIVFDEVDSGIGGRVAEVVGRKLRDIAAREQVLCVTHLPQIAAFASTHYAVRKRVVNGRTISEVAEVTGDERAEEMARMLGGETMTAVTRRHAREMLDAATASPRKGK